jgi:hypothetical protein
MPETLQVPENLTFPALINNYQITVLNSTITTLYAAAILIGRMHRTGDTDQTKVRPG